MKEAGFITRHVALVDRKLDLRVVASDLGAYESFLKRKLTRLDGIASIESSFALQQVKYSIALPT